MSDHATTKHSQDPLWAGNLLLPLRWVLGWAYFSAFWRRLILENKMDMDAPGYVGEKFNHFLPNALFIQGPIEFFLLHPELLWWKMLLFTLFEGVVGLALIVGVATRAAGLSVAGLAMGILLSAGWLGTTCLDEWQIGTMGIAAGLAVFFGGGGRCSLDAAIQKKTNFRLPPILQWIIEPGPVLDRVFQRILVPSAIAVIFLTLATNQIFHGGVWGTLHNKSVSPIVEITDASVHGDRLTATFFRVQGADVYGSFAIALRLQNDSGETVVNWDAAALAAMSPESFNNHYIAQVKAGKNALILPLGAKAEVTFQNSHLQALPPGTYHLELEDVNGTVWSAPVNLVRGS